MLFGVLQDKDMDGIAEILAPEVDTIVLTSVPETARTANPWELQEKFRRYRPHSSIIVENDFEKALSLSRTLTSPDSWVLVTGSLYLVGAVRRVLGLYTFTRP
jgi:dihydrofolate synthase/folylpolyglutamate synthase